MFLLAAAGSRLCCSRPRSWMYFGACVFAGQQMWKIHFEVDVHLLGLFRVTSAPLSVLPWCPAGLVLSPMQALCPSQPGSSLTLLARPTQMPLRPLPSTSLNNTEVCPARRPAAGGFPSVAMQRVLGASPWVSPPHAAAVEEVGLRLVACNYFACEIHGCW